MVNQSERNKLSEDDSPMESVAPKVWLSVGPGIQVKGTAKTAASLKWQTFLCLLSDYVDWQGRSLTHLG